MFDIAPTEFLLVAIVALVVIGPKDLPRAMRLVGKWVGRARGVARQFRSGIDTMIRESELADMEKKWAAENERIMRDYPPAPALPSPEAEGEDAVSTDAQPILVEQPSVHADADSAVAPKPKRGSAKPKVVPPATETAVTPKSVAKPRAPRKPKAAS